MDKRRIEMARQSNGFSFNSVLKFTDKISDPIWQLAFRNHRLSEK